MKRDDGWKQGDVITIVNPEALTECRRMCTRCAHRDYREWVGKGLWLFCGLTGFETWDGDAECEDYEEVEG